MSAIVHMVPVMSPWWSSAQHLNDLGNALLENKQPVILIGKQGVGKTSLLFQSAVTYASEGGTVVFICDKPLSHIPLTVHGMPSPDPSVLQSVRFLYMSDVEELVEFCASIHTKANYPNVIIVDNVDVYVNQIKGNCVEHAAAKLAALLTDTANFIQQKSNKECSIVMSASENIPSLPSVLKQFNMNPVLIDKADSTTDDYKLCVDSQDSSMQVTFSITKSSINLKQIKFAPPQP